MFHPKRQRRWKDVLVENVLQGGSNGRVTSHLGWIDVDDFDVGQKYRVPHKKWVKGTMNKTCGRHRGVCDLQGGCGVLLFNGFGLRRFVGFLIEQHNQIYQTFLGISRPKASFTTLTLSTCSTYNTSSPADNRHGHK